MASKTFSGGEALEAKLREIAKQAGKAGTLNVGFLENATYPDGTSVAMVAAIQEFGAPAVGIPPRPFFRNMIAAKSPGWAQSLGNLAVNNDYDMEKTLGQMGEGLKGQLQQEIIDTNDPPLSPVTVMLRGMRSHDQNLVVTGKTVGEAAQRVDDGLTNYGASDKVLDDSGHMINSVDYQVKTGKPT
jgi:hypothetical protein